ncbi:MAG: hypothetical protein HKM24_00360, partial [Gammaproteobacteria bacterium]|nr:hypothetical protein [Gammaproteobacteria bacterium]
ASDEHSAIDFVRVNGVNATSSDDFATWQAAVVLEPESVNSIEAVVQDNSGNFVVIDSILVAHADTSIPSVSVTTPSASGAQTAGDTMFLGGVATDASSTIAAVRVNGVDAMSAGNATDLSQWSLEVSLSLGVNTFNIEAEDASGNVSDAINFTVERVASLSNPPPTASIVFPPNNTKATSQFITVRGTADDTDGIAWLSVNGTPATTSDEFSNWQAVIPLTHGDEFMLTVDAQDNQGGVGTAIARNGLGVAQGFGAISFKQDISQQMESSRLENAVYTFYRVFSGGPDEIIKTNLDTGESGVVSGPTVGNGPELDLISFVLNADETKIYGVADQGFARKHIVEIDIASGDRIVYALNLDESLTVAGVASHADNGSCYVSVRSGVDSYEAVYEFNTSTQVLNIVLDDVETLSSFDDIWYITNGSGATTTSEMKFDHTNNRLLLLIESLANTEGVEFLSYDVVSEVVSVLPINYDTGLSPFNDFGFSALTHDGTTVFGRAGSNSRMYKFDIATQLMSLWYEVSTDGSDPSNIYHLATQSSDATALVSSLNGLYLIAEDGSVQTSITLSNGNGESLSLNALVIDESRSRIVAGQSSKLYSIDLATGDRVLIDPSFSGLVNSMALFDSDQKILIGRSNALPYILDLTTDIGSAVPDDTMADPLNQPYVAEYDANRMLAVVSNGVGSSSTENYIATLDIATGTRQLVSDNTFVGEPLDWVLDMAIDTTQDRYLISNWLDERIIAVDPTTGVRSFVYESASDGLGPDLDSVECLHYIPGTNTTLVCSDRDLVSINMVDSTRTTVVGDSDGYGPGIALRDLATDVTNDLIYAASTGPDAVYVIDPQSGDRVILSR